MLKGNDLVITLGEESVGYVFPQTVEFGQPSVHLKRAVQVPLNIGASTPAQAGGAYDVRDSEGVKALAHLSWHLGAGQKTLDTADASPYMFETSRNMDISQKGELSVLPTTGYSQLTATGPIASLLGHLYVARYGGGLYDITGDAVACTGLPDNPVTSLCSDGASIYATVPTGASAGIYKASPSDNAFSRVSEELISILVFTGGFFFGAYTDSGKCKVAMLNDDMEIDSDLITPDALSTVTTVGLATSGRYGDDVFWLVSAESQAYVYQISYSANFLSVQQFAEFPSGFNATCIFGYLASVYVGGYWSSEYSNVAQGQIYVCADGYTAPLMELGERPKRTPDPADNKNDNRVWSITGFERDLIFTTSRGIYRWDIDDGGYSHLAPLDNSGLGEQQIVFVPGTPGVDPPPISWNPTPEDLTRPAGWALSMDSPGVSWHTTDGNLPVQYGSHMPGDARLVVYRADYDFTVAEIDFTVFEDPEGGLPIGYKAFDIVVYNRSASDLTASSLALVWNRYDASNGVVLKRGHPHRTVRYTDGVLTYSDDWYWDFVGRNVTGGPTWWELEGNIPLQNLFYAGKLTVWDEKSKPGYVNLYGGDRHTLRIMYVDGRYPVYLDGEYVEELGNPEPDVGGQNGYDNPESSCFYLSFYSYIGIYSVNIDDGTVVVDPIPPRNDVEVLSFSGVATHKGRIYAPYYVASEVERGVSSTTRTINPTASLKQSKTTLHTGTLYKDFKYVDVRYGNATELDGFDMKVTIDGVTRTITDYTEPIAGVRRFAIGTRGTDITTELVVRHKNNARSSAVFCSINVFWDFVKVRMHEYILDCRAGAAGGRWMQDAESAIGFINKCGDSRVLVEDAVSGEYYGNIESIEYIKANTSTLEGPSGIVKLVIREE